MTYRELRRDLLELSDSQLDREVTIEGGEYGCEPSECLQGELRITGNNHPSFCSGRPTIFITE